MLGGGEASSHLFAALQQCEPLAGAQHFHVEPDNGFQGGVQRVKGRRGGFPVLDDTQTHTPKLTGPTDKNRA